MKKLAFIIICVLPILLASCACRHEWIERSCVNPKTCIKCGETEGSFGHVWVPATCEKPKRCYVCGKQDGETLDHSWIAATCTAPEKCSSCGVTVGEPLSHVWSAATCKKPMTCTLCGTTKGTVSDHKLYGLPKTCTVCDYMEPLPLPQNGQIFIGSELYRTSKLTIHASQNDNCYVKLKSTIGNDVFSFFVRAGKTVKMSVPSGYYYVYFSYGKEWYGTKYIFGSDTTYSKDDEICDFKNYTWEYTLYSIYDGNFSETPVSAEEFQ